MGAGVQLESRLSGQRLSDVSGGAATTLAAAGVMFLAVADVRRIVLPKTSLVAAIWVTATVLICGVALGVMIRLCAGASASRGQWLRRSAAGAVLLMPAAMSLTRPVEGSDISTCGTLLDPGRLPYADLDEVQGGRSQHRQRGRRPTAATRPRHTGDLPRAYLELDRGQPVVYLFGYPPGYVVSAACRRCPTAA
jgi:hypothetical protein